MIIYIFVNLVLKAGCPLNSLHQCNQDFALNNELSINIGV